MSTFQKRFYMAKMQEDTKIIVLFKDSGGILIHLAIFKCMETFAFLDLQNQKHMNLQNDTSQCS